MAIGGVGATLVTVACLAASASRPAVLAAEKAPKLSDSGASVLDAGVGMVDVGHDADEENAALVAAAHDLRRALTPPHQSLFRVVCILVYEDFSGNLHRITGGVRGSQYCCFLVFDAAVHSILLYDMLE